MSKLSLWKTIGLVGVFCAAAVVASPAGTFTILVSFNGGDGQVPKSGSLVQGLDGNFYGTTYFAGCCNGGTLFKMTPGGKLTTLHSFCSSTDCADGGFPQGGLVLATDGNLYGTTGIGGAHEEGTVFKITPEGTLTTLYSFCAQSGCTDGANPNGPLVQATDGNFYGTTDWGGAHGDGTVFKITPEGTLTTLHSFDNTDGRSPQAGLIQATDGNFYGTTGFGGATSCDIGGFNDGCGTVFKITPGGTLTTLHSFDLTDGAGPSVALVQASDGNFYGTTAYGGAYNNCYPYTRCGTVFKITPGGTLTTLHSFDGTDGANPYAGLVQATDGNFYGTTSGPAFFPVGTVFRITPGGTLTTLHSFSCDAECPDDGGSPQAGLVQATNGSFYGTTAGGGTYGLGTVFSLSVGLGPFVETLPTSGEVGAPVMILGTELTGATSVTFDGIAATFTVVSSSEITTTVPSGAATGNVRVTTPKGTLICNVKFRVTPTISDFSPPSGPVGTSVVVTGEGFRGATCISIGGVMATSFTVDSDTQITATVPTGAKTGHIAVSTLGGTAVSAGTFTVN
jgi:uncharacterized repeat protein (TIGR03803 family)